jgi:molybdopterin converting factor small subunit
MIIEVKLFSSLLHYIPDSERRLDRYRWDVPDGATVEQVLEMLNLPEEEATVLLINGRNVKRENVLKEGDVLHVFPPMAGG